MLNVPVSIDVGTLIPMHSRADVMVFDCRFSLADFSAGRCAYREGHIPGAAFLDMEEDLSGPKNSLSGRHPLPACGDFQARLRAAGLRRNMHVIAYDDQKLAGAARLWWLLKYFGHDRVSVLDGGFAAWREAGLAVSTLTPEFAAGDIELAPGHLRVVSTEEVRAICRDGSATLIDCREVTRFRGEAEPIDPVAGHIPGAMNAPWQDAVTDAGVLLASPRHIARWQNLKATRPVVVYCGSGVTAAVNAMSLYVAGFPMPALYAGSWSQWCSDRKNPVARSA